MLDGNNWLLDMAERVNASAAAMQDAANVFAERALETGRLLIEAKSECPHGDWLAFLKRAGVAERQAQRLMSLVRGGVKPDMMSDLGVAGALDYVRRRQLPESERALVLTLGGDGESISETAHSVLVWESRTCPGYFHVAEWIGPEQAVAATKRPIRGDAMVNGAPVIYHVIDKLFAGRWAEVRIFTSEDLAVAIAVRDAALDGVDDFDGRRR